jgi:putative phosphoribosyl transferase
MKATWIFSDRAEAGRLLAARLAERNYDRPVVLALPRGGLPVGLEVARALNAPMDAVLVRKIGVPWQPELAAAAVVNGDNPEVVRNEGVIAMADIGEEYMAAEAAKKLKEIELRRERYLKGRPQPEVRGCTAIVVDDGIATGATMRAALRATRRRGPARLVLAVPVAPPESVTELSPEVDEVVCLATPEPFFAIGIYYRDFTQVEDEQAIAALDAARTFGERKNSAAPNPGD